MSWLKILEYIFVYKNSHYKHLYINCNCIYILIRNSKCLINNIFFCCQFLVCICVSIFGFYLCVNFWFVFVCQFLICLFCSCTPDTEHRMTLPRWVHGRCFKREICFSSVSPFQNLRLEQRLMYKVGGIAGMMIAPNSLVRQKEGAQGGGGGLGWSNALCTSLA